MGAQSPRGKLAVCTWAERAYIPLVILHTCTSWTLPTPGTCFISATSAGRLTLLGVASSRMSVVSRTIRHAPTAISTAMPTERIGSIGVQPVSRMTRPATMTPTEAPTSPKTWRAAAFALRFSCSLFNPKPMKRLTAMPTPADANMNSGWTGSG